MFLLRVLVLCAVAVCGTDAMWCYDCRSVVGHCNDGTRGVNDKVLTSCEGIQCTKIVRRYERDDGESNIETERGCVEYGAPPVTVGCQNTHQEIEEKTKIVQVKTTACYCGTPYCNTGGRSVAATGWMVMMVAVLVGAAWAIM